MAASKQSSKQAYTRTRAQCSHASVGLTQAHPNDVSEQTDIPDPLENRLTDRKGRLTTILSI